MQLNPSTPETPETPEMISGNPGKADSGNSGNSLEYRSPELPSNPDPLATPGVRRILLSERASEALTESGEECFAIVARQSWPHDPKRWAIYLLPVALRVANDATAVLLGKARAVRSRKPASKP